MFVACLKANCREDQWETCETLLCPIPRPIAKKNDDLENPHQPLLTAPGIPLLPPLLSQCSQTLPGVPILALNKRRTLSQPGIALLRQQSGGCSSSPRGSTASPRAGPCQEQEMSFRAQPCLTAGLPAGSDVPVCADGTHYQAPQPQQQQLQQLPGLGGVKGGAEATAVTLAPEEQSVWYPQYLPARARQGSNPGQAPDFQQQPRPYLPPPPGAAPQYQQQHIHAYAYTYLPPLPHQHQQQPYPPQQLQHPHQQYLGLQDAAVGHAADAAVVVLGTSPQAPLPLPCPPASDAAHHLQHLRIAAAPIHGPMPPAVGVAHVVTPAQGSEPAAAAAAGAQEGDSSYSPANMQQQEQEVAVHQQQQQQQTGARLPQHKMTAAEVSGGAAAMAAVGGLIPEQQHRGNLQARFPACVDGSHPPQQQQQQPLHEGVAAPARGLSGEQLLVRAGALPLQDTTIIADDQQLQQDQKEHQKLSSSGPIPEGHQSQQQVEVQAQLQQKGSLGGAQPQLQQQQQESSGRAITPGLGDQGSSPPQCWGRPLATVVPHSPTVRQLSEQQQQQQQQVVLASVTVQGPPPQQQQQQQQQQDSTGWRVGGQDRWAGSRMSAPGASPGHHHGSSSSEPAAMRRSLPGAVGEPPHAVGLAGAAGGSGAGAIGGTAAGPLAVVIGAGAAGIAAAGRAHAESYGASASPLAPPGAGVPGLEPALTSHVPNQGQQQQQQAVVAVGAAMSPAAAAGPGPSPVPLLPTSPAADPWDHSWAAAVPANKRVRLSSLQFGQQVGEGGFGKVGAPGGFFDSLVMALDCACIPLLVVFVNVRPSSGPYMHKVELQLLNVRWAPSMFL